MTSTTRSLPDNITIPNFKSYQVRIVRGDAEYSASFAWSRYETKKHALQEAVKWRDMMLAKLPPPENGKGSFRRTAMAGKRTYGRVGITRYIRKDYRRDGDQQYLVFGVNWTDDQARQRIKQFQVGKVGNFTWENELEAALTAEAFRTHWEYAVTMNIPFDPEHYKNWRGAALYPFVPAHN